MTSKFQLVPADIQDRIKELPRQTATMEGLAALWLFGSRGRGEATLVSDVDLAYLPERDLTGEPLERFETVLYGRIAGTLHTDEFALVNLRQAPAYFAWKVVSEGKALVCHDAKEVALVAEAAYQQAPDIHWLRHGGNVEFLRGVRMPEPTIDKDRVTEFLRLISADLKVLQEKVGVAKEVYVDSGDLQAIVERRLQTAIEGCLNVGNHLIARLALRAPQDYADVFRVLGEARVLPKELVTQMTDMARFRNLLVHVYWAIDHKRVYDALPARQSALDSFVRTIALWLTERKST